MIALQTPSAGDTELTFIPTAGKKTDLIAEFEAAGNETMADVWDWSVARYREKKLVGTRDILGEEDEVQPNGKMFKKLELGDYRWLTYEEVINTFRIQLTLPLRKILQVDTMADNFGRGLRVLGLQPGQNLCLYADTRAEWLVAAQASFKQSFPVVTIYTNLGESGVIHGLSETQATTVITSHELLPKFKEILMAKKDQVTSSLDQKILSLVVGEDYRVHGEPHQADPGARVPGRRPPHLLLGRHLAW